MINDHRAFYIKHIDFPFSVSSIEKTVDRILEHRCSVSRFGDGEFLLIKNTSIRFQKKNKNLAKELDCILRSPSESFLITVSPIFSSINELNEEEQRWWSKYLFFNQFFLKKHLLHSDEYEYGSTFISRPYLSYENKNKDIIGKRFSYIQKLWENRNIVFVEGKYSRLGYGNDLFSNATSIKRILCPPENAYSFIEEIEETIISTASKDDLIMLALGPTATVLANRLYKKGFQAIDIGHIDVEYEWFRMGATKKVPIPNKIVNEAGSHKTLVLSALNEEYKASIIKEIK